MIGGAPAGRSREVTSCARKRRVRGGRVPTPILLIILLFLGSIVTPDGARADQRDLRSTSTCHAPRDMARLSAPLTVASSAMSRDRDFRIVALGSSSTQGTGASSPKMCYPAQLAGELNRRFHPDKHFEVVNLGVGGEMATHMLARMDSEVLSLKPDLVIWQTGVNDAITAVPLDDFRDQLIQGIIRIRAAGADVILLDLQYYPRSERVAGYKDYLKAMWQVASDQGVPVLRRYTFMKHLIDSRQFTPAQLLAPDLFHQNDLSYRCLGRFVADAIGDGIDKAVRSVPKVGRSAAAVR